MLDAVNAAAATPAAGPDPTEAQAQDLIAAHTRFGAVDATGLAQAVAQAPGDRATLAADVARALPHADQPAFVQGITVIAHRQTAPSTTPSSDAVDHSLWGQVKDAGGVLWGAAKDFGNLAGGVARTGYDLGLGPVADAARQAVGLAAGHTPDAPSWAPSTDRGVQSVESAGKTLYTAATHPGAVWDGLKAPYQQDIQQGRWGALIAQAAVDFGGLADGESEAVDVARGASVAQKVADGVKDVDRGAQTAEHVASSTEQTARAADEAKTAETAASGAEGLTRVTAKVGENEVTWSVNSAGRGVKADAILRETFDGAVRGKDETKLTKAVGATGQAGDDGGHMIAHRFALDQGEKNMFPQQLNFNRGAYKTMENEWADWTKAGGEVHTHVELKTFDNGRPDQVRVTYSVKDPATGKKVYDNRVRFQNQSGQSFTRKSPAEIDALMKGQ